MRHTVFLAITGDAKFQIRVGQLGCAANCTPVQRLRLGLARLHFESSSPRADLTTIARVMHNVWSEENEIIGHGTDCSGAELHRADYDLHEQNAGRKPRN